MFLQPQVVKKVTFDSNRITSSEAETLSTPTDSPTPRCSLPAGRFGRIAHGDLADLAQARARDVGHPLGAGAEDADGHVQFGGGDLIGLAHRSGSIQHTHFHVQTGRCCHVDQRIEAEQVDLATHQVGDTRLRHAKQLGGLCLAHSGAGDVFFERHHQLGTQLHCLDLGRRVLNCIPRAGIATVTHGPDQLGPVIALQAVVRHGRCSLNEITTLPSLRMVNFIPHARASVSGHGLEEMHPLQRQQYRDGLSRRQPHAHDAILRRTGEAVDAASGDDGLDPLQQVVRCVSPHRAYYPIRVITATRDRPRGWPIPERKGWLMGSSAAAGRRGGGDQHFGWWYASQRFSAGAAPKTETWRVK